MFSNLISAIAELTRKQRPVRGLVPDKLCVRLMGINDDKGHASVLDALDKLCSQYA